MRLNPPWKSEKSNSGERDIYSRLKQEINPVRKQNEPPSHDGESFSRYICDLCHRPGRLSDHRQCVICGKWACEYCWNERYYLCNSCSGIMNLMLLEQKEILPAESETEEFKIPSKVKDLGNE